MAFIPEEEYQKSLSQNVQPTNQPLNYDVGMQAQPVAQPMESTPDWNVPTETMPSQNTWERSKAQAEQSNVNVAEGVPVLNTIFSGAVGMGQQLMGSAAQTGKSLANIVGGLGDIYSGVSQKLQQGTAGQITPESYQALKGVSEVYQGIPGTYMGVVGMLTSPIGGLIETLPTDWKTTLKAAMSYPSQYAQDYASSRLQNIDNQAYESLTPEERTQYDETRQNVIQGSGDITNSLMLKAGKVVKVPGMERVTKEGVSKPASIYDIVTQYTKPVVTAPLGAIGKGIKTIGAQFISKGSATKLADIKNIYEQGQKNLPYFQQMLANPNHPITQFRNELSTAYDNIKSKITELGKSYNPIREANQQLTTGIFGKKNLLNIFSDTLNLKLGEKGLERTSQTKGVGATRGYLGEDTINAVNKLMNQFPKGLERSADFLNFREGLNGIIEKLELGTTEGSLITNVAKKMTDLSAREKALMEIKNIGKSLEPLVNLRNEFEKSYTKSVSKGAKEKVLDDAKVNRILNIDEDLSQTALGTLSKFLPDINERIKSAKASTAVTKQAEQTTGFNSVQFMLNMAGLNPKNVLKTADWAGKMDTALKTKLAPAQDAITKIVGSKPVQTALGDLTNLLSKDKVRVAAGSVNKGTPKVEIKKVETAYKSAEKTLTDMFNKFNIFK